MLGVTVARGTEVPFRYMRFPEHQQHDQWLSQAALSNSTKFMKLVCLVRVECIAGLALHIPGGHVRVRCPRAPPARLFACANGPLGRTGDRWFYLKHGTHGSCLIRHQRGRPGVVLPFVISNSANP